MTVPASYVPTLIVASGATGTFPYNFPVLDAADLLVEADGVEVTSGFTVTGVGDPAGGDVIFTVNPVAGTEIGISRDMEFKRDTDYQTLGDLIAATLNADFDRPVMMIQQLYASFQALSSSFATSLAELLAVYGTGIGNFLQAGVGAIVRLAQDKMRERISVLDFGAIGNGVADDTLAIIAGDTHCKAIGAKLIFPRGIYRVTSAIAQTTAYSVINWEGETGKIFENMFTPTTARGAVILLDSVDAAGCFMRFNNRYTLQLKNLEFRCNQYVLDRDFLRFESGAVGCHKIENCGFVNVERPIVYKSGSYFQNAVLRDVQFNSSGTIHSEVVGVGLIGTLLKLDNVNHEGAVPANTEKVVCNLSGIRQIEGGNFLLEGSLPAANWTVLRVHNPYDAVHFRINFANFTNVHIEFAGTPALYSVDQIGGAVHFNQLVGPQPTQAHYKLSSYAKVVIDNMSFAGTTDDPSTYFLLENAQCQVTLRDCVARVVDFSKLGMTYERMQIGSTIAGNNQIVVSNTAAQEIYRWKGGLPVAEGLAVFNPEANYNVQTDATYGRKIVATAVANALTLQLTCPSPGPVAASLGIGDTLWVAARIKLPVFTTGLVRVTLIGDGISPTQTFGPALSNTVVDVLIPIVATIDVAAFGVSFGIGTSTDVTGSYEIYSLAFYQGCDAPRHQVPHYPVNISTHASAAPATGVWKVGDYVRNSAPAVGSPKGWYCTAVPTTFTSEGNL